MVLSHQDLIGLLLGRLHQSYNDLSQIHNNPHANQIDVSL